MESVTLISVMRDLETYRKCISENANVGGCRVVMADNREKNEGVPVCYNRFLDSFDFSEPSWLVFCHEDFEFLESPRKWLDGCDKTKIVGPVGSRTRRVWPFLFGGYWKSEMVGRIEQCGKRGENPHFTGLPTICPTEVETLDCQCLAVHSSLVAERRLRFDEELTFDLYAEDFCICAKESFGVSTCVVPLACRHWSGGTIGERYLRADEHLAKKYQRSIYAAPALFAVGGGGSLSRRLQTRFFKRRIVGSRKPAVSV